MEYFGDPEALIGVQSLGKGRFKFYCKIEPCLWSHTADATKDDPTACGLKAGLHLIEQHGFKRGYNVAL